LVRYVGYVASVPEIDCSRIGLARPVVIPNSYQVGRRPALLPRPISTIRPLRRLAGGQAGVGLHRRCAALSDLHTRLPCHRLTRLSSSPGHRWRCFGRRVRRTSTRSSRIGSSVSGVSQRARSSGGNCTREGVSVNRLCKSTGELRVAGGGKGGGMRSRCVKSWTPARVCRLRSCRRSSPWCEPSGPERQGNSLPHAVFSGKMNSLKKFS
jgi:hypothetical protein